jgi:hypothetical protein
MEEKEKKNGPGLAQLRTATPGRLRSLLMEFSSPILLLGAGASVRSGIPLADTTVELAARWAWCKDHGRPTDDIRVRRSDYWPWLTAKPWYRSDVALADVYPDAIDHLLPVKADRRAFFEKITHPDVPPSEGFEASLLTSI